MQQATKVDDLTVELTMATPWVALPSALSGITGLMVSPTAAAAGTLDRQPVGTGPYRLREWDADQQIVVERNDGYWGTETAPLDTLTYRFFPIETARVAAFEAGEIDAFVTVAAETIERERADGAQVMAPARWWLRAAVCSTPRWPRSTTCGSGEPWRSVTTATRSRRRTRGDGYDEASFSPFARPSEWWVAPESPPGFDPQGAKDLLADYGQPVSFTIDLLAGSQDIEDSVRAMVEYWNDLGTDIRLDVLPDVGTYITKALSQDFTAIVWLGVATGDPDYVLYDLFHTDGAENLTGYSNPAVDAALDAGRATADPAVRRDAYATVQQQLRADLPVLIGSHSGITIVADPSIGGLEPSSSFPSRTIHLTG